MDILEYHNGLDLGSNHHNQVVSAICDFEIVLAGVSNGYYEDITLMDVLFFVASANKSPPFGLKKDTGNVLMETFHYHKHPLVA